MLVQIRGSTKGFDDTALQKLHDRLIFAILAASASYIAVPAAMKLSNPEADEGLYVPMALAVTFPFNLTLGMPIYWMIIQAT